QGANGRGCPRPCEPAGAACLCGTPASSLPRAEGAPKSHPVQGPSGRFGREDIASPQRADKSRFTLDTEVRGTMAGRRARTMLPDVFHASVALALGLLGAVGLLLAFRPALSWAYCLAAWLFSINVVAFGYYGYDKGQARQSSRRVPEVVLHGLSVVGGSLGAYAGMQLFRHKTIKGSFRIFFWFVVVLQVALIAAIVYRLLKH